MGARVLGVQILGRDKNLDLFKSLHFSATITFSTFWSGGKNLPDKKFLPLFRNIFKVLVGIFYNICIRHFSV